MLAPMSIPSPPTSWQSFRIGPLEIHIYALIIVAGIIIAVLWTNRRLTRRGAEPWIIVDIGVPAVVLGIVFARLYHVFTHPGDYFGPGHQWWEMFAIWEGGNAIIGALIGGAIAAWLVCKARGLRFLSFADAAAPTILFAQALGRLGNYMNHELYGWPTDLPWGLEIESTNPAFPAGLPAGTLFHPTFLYELLWNLLGVGLILLLERMLRMRWGKTLALYLMWYGAGRMVIESIRVDYSEVILGLRSNVLGALVLALIGIVLFIVQLRRHPEPELSVYTERMQARLAEAAAAEAAKDGEAAQDAAAAQDAGAAKDGEVEQDAPADSVAAATGNDLVTDDADNSVSRGS